jgi:DNA-binding CsgD family transcriptional regulator
LTAIDDFGAGFNGHELLSRFQPDIVKLDMKLIRGIDSDKHKQQFLEKILSLCRKRGILVIAEGIETLEELDCVRRMGIALCQGFLLCKPILEGLATALRFPAICGDGRTDLPSTSVRIGNHPVAPKGPCEPEIVCREVGGEEPTHIGGKSCLLESSDTTVGAKQSWSGRFTPKELRILALLAKGNTCEEIAIKLNAPGRTIKNYLRALLSTTGSSDLSELAEFTVAQLSLELDPRYPEGAWGPTSPRHPQGMVGSLTKDGDLDAR